MQYLAWPDHGVPDDSVQFLEFTERVRKARVGMVEPTIVHCSAGIGRTGVLILMETAMCLIEANEPVYPLDIVRAMRDQRAMMIQTAVSIEVLSFLCLCFIFHLYHPCIALLSTSQLDRYISLTIQVALRL
jgi:protein tyrosine phosphatase